MLRRALTCGRPRHLSPCPVSGTCTPRHWFGGRSDCFPYLILPLSDQATLGYRSGSPSKAIPARYPAPLQSYFPTIPAAPVFRLAAHGETIKKRTRGYPPPIAGQVAVSGSQSSGYSAIVLAIYSRERRRIESREKGMGRSCFCD
jgi:hypothetical protein